jgi:transcriptional regulator with PAS, ATPase and Fis domain
VNCGAVPEALLEAAFFGHERGAFTGADRPMRGHFEQAHGGTLFLDEIGDISPKLQLDLLRVLEERRLTRVGGTEPVDVDVRIIAATNRDLTKAVADGQFREDLFYRLNVIPILLPPLRDRREDVPLLVEHFLERLSVETDRQIEGVSADALAALVRHDWPGNVRELRNVLERGMVVAKDKLVQPEDLGLGGPGIRPEAYDPTLTLDEVERRHITAVLQHSGGNVTQAARTLAIDRVTLYNKIRKYGLRRGDDDGFNG